MTDPMQGEQPITFSELGLSPEILRGVEEAGFTAASPVQAQAIPLVLEGRDLIAQAHTGTGKTAAFGLPAMSLIDAQGGVGLLVIVPTRELAMQVSDELYRLGRYAGLHTAAIYGGQSYRRQLESVERGCQIVVATPGRMLDLLDSGKVAIAPSIVVLDEADEMLDMGFLDDIKAIFDHLPGERQTLLFSATMPAPIAALANTILKNPARVAVKQTEATNVNIEQRYCVIEEYEREDALIRLIDAEEPGKCIIFCRTKSEVDHMATRLIASGSPAAALHGDIEQKGREKIIRSFRGGETTILVATDVAARGLDVSDVTHVFNYHVSFNPESYVHRIGRTGRAGKSGIAITLVTPHELREIGRIQHKTGKEMQQTLIPTRSEVRRSQGMKLIEQVRHQPIDDAAAELMLALEEEIDLAQLSIKLISMLLERDTVAGPERIGLSGERLQRATERMQDRRSGAGGGRYGDRGGDRRGGGGRFGNKGGNTGGNQSRWGDKPERPAKSEWSDRSEKSEWTPKPERSDRSERPAKPSFADKGNRPERSGWGDKPAARGPKESFGERKPPQRGEARSWEKPAFGKSADKPSTYKPADKPADKGSGKSWGDKPEKKGHWSDKKSSDWQGAAGKKPEGKRWADDRSKSRKPKR